MLLTQKSVARWWLLSSRSRGQAQLWGGAGKALPLPGDVLCVLAHLADLQIASRFCLLNKMKIVLV